MAVVFDPHQKQPGNKITGEPGTVIGTKYRMLVPKNGPFYTGSLVVKSGGKILNLAGDYVITHPYMTAMQRTGRSAHGMIWIVNDKYTKDFTVDYHAIGLGGASSDQVTAERARNSDVYPSECQWEQVIGDVYFPPVDIQFDWDNWKGERELMLAIGAIGKKMTQIIKLPDPITKNLGTLQLTLGGNATTTDANWTYDNAGTFKYKGAARRSVALTWMTKDGKNKYDDYSLDFGLFNQTYSNSATELLSITLAYYPGNTYLSVLVRPRNISVQLLMNIGSSSRTYSVMLGDNLPIDEMDEGYRVKVKRYGSNAKYDITVTTKNRTVTTTIDLDNPPAEFAPGFTVRDVAGELKRPTYVSASFIHEAGDTMTILDSPGMPAGDVADDMYTILVRYHQLVDSLYRNSPAIAHVADKNNPHGDDSYGRMRAIETNGIASDATLVYGKTQPQLADYVNGLSAKNSDFTDKMLRTGADRTITGTFTMMPGLASVTSSKDAESNGVGTNLQVDDKAIRLISRDSSTIKAGNNPITFKAGANAFVLYPDSRGLRWNDKIILDPTTVGQYLPGNSGGGDGIYYGKNSDSVTITGNGIETQPFICTWVPPSDTNVNTLALRMLTNDYGTSESLAATPALIQKLAGEFTGKLEKSRAYINGMSLMSSITIDKFTFNLGNVSNIPDDSLPVSDLQATEFAKYSVVGHKHTADAFGIGNATTAKAGLVKFGGLVDDATLALDGSYVVKQLDQLTALERDAGKSDANSVVDILRYGTAGSSVIEGAATVSKWIVTIKANNYFVGLDYPVPLATFNLTELFPGAYEETNFGIFVDVSDNAAKYVIKDKSNLAENDTMTRIGDITTDDAGIATATIRNVTRLGSFRELEDHTADINAHTPRTMSQAQYGYTFGSIGPAWVSGGKSFTRGDGDWRQYGQTDFIKMDNVDVDGNAFVFAKNTSMRRMLHMTPLQSVASVTASFAPVTAAAFSTSEFVLFSYMDNGKRINISLLVSANGFIGVTGKRTYVALAVNYGGGTGSFTVGLDAGEYLVSETFDNMKPVYNYALVRDVSQGLYAQGVVTLLNYSMSYKLTLKGTPTLVVTRTDTGATQTIDLTSRFAAANINVSAVAVDASIPVLHGVGGIFTAPVRCTMAYTDALFLPQARYATAIDVLNNISDMGRIRTFNKFVSLSTVPNMAESLTADTFAAKGNRPWGVPDYINLNRMPVYHDGKTAFGVVLRD